MSWEVTTHFFETQEIRLDVITRESLQELEKSVCNMIKQRLEKLNLLIKDMNVFYHEDHLIVNDRYKICGELEKIAKAFGFRIERLECAMRGVSYILTDPLIETLRQIGVSDDVLSEAANQSTTQEIAELIYKNAMLKASNAGLLDMINNIRENGVYVSAKKRSVSETTDGNILLSRSEGAWDVDENGLKSRLTSFAAMVQNQISATSKEMVAGTTQLIHYRARQMGYAVEEKRNGKEVQLVLVRLS